MMRDCFKKIIRPLAAMLLAAVLCDGAFAAQRGRAQRLLPARPEAAGMSSARLAEIADAVNEAIERGNVPGAVVLVGRRGRVVYRKAFGARALEPAREAMTIDTIFDLASLTKVVATATSIMILVERGQLSLADPVARYIPEFARFGKERITIEQLMTHRAGFPPDNDISDYVGVSVDPLREIYNLRPVYEPGSRFVYSDVGFIVAAELVRRVSGRPLDRFAAEEIFEPLGMRDTKFVPGASPRIAPTERREGRWLRGEVHDPRAAEMNGVAGHAGLFSTADDLAIFCQMILNGGAYGGARVLAPYTIERMVSAHSLPTSEMRGIGWDVNTAFGAPRGDLFPVGSFGHTGFTGTSVWIDPASQTFVILLTSRLHPRGPGDVTRLRSAISSIVAASIIEPPHREVFESLKRPTQVETPRAAMNRGVPAGLLHPVMTGLDVLARHGFRQLAGRRVGLITNHTGRDRDGRSAIDLLAAARDVRLVAIFSPEHGLRGLEDAPVGDIVDEKTGVRVFSLYTRDRRRPTDEMLAGIDTLVFDVQDIGARFYTYATTCLYAMEEAARRGLKFVVLDRPNPINGYDIEGPVADERFTREAATAFTTPARLPVRHGMTIGELMTMLNAERRIGADLTVVKMEGWRRADYYDATALPWVNPSPNMRSLTAALLYPGVALLEYTNVSVGRGTDTPFEVMGAPWIDGVELASALNRAGLPGVRFVPVRFTPKDSRFKGEPCGGINILITDRASFRPVAMGIEIAVQLRRLYKDQWKVEEYARLLAHDAAFDALQSGLPAYEVASRWQADLAAFAATRKRYLLY